MKTIRHNSLLNTTDEFTGFYNWSERTAIFFRSKKQRTGVRLADLTSDILCMSAMAIAMLQTF